MRPVNDPYGGVNPLIDKMIGNAYNIVRYVAYHLKEIRYVAENMEDIHAVATGTVRSQALVTAVATNSTSLPLPEDIPVNDIQAMSVLITTSTGEIYLPSVTSFNVIFDGSNLVVTLVGAPPTGVLGGTIKWLITHQPTPEE